MYGDFYLFCRCCKMCSTFWSRWRKYLAIPTVCDQERNIFHELLHSNLLRISLMLRTLFVKGLLWFLRNGFQYEFIRYGYNLMIQKKIQWNFSWIYDYYKSARMQSYGKSSVKRKQKCRAKLLVENEQNIWGNSTV